MINWKCRPSDRVIEGYLKMRADEPFKPAVGITPYGLRAACLAAARLAAAEWHRRVKEKKTGTVTLDYQPGTNSKGIT